MTQFEQGQCGTCRHFGEPGDNSDDLVQLRISGEAPDGYRNECGLPSLASLHLSVTVNSSCEGYEAA